MLRGYCGPNIMAIPYKNFKERMRITKLYLDKYKIEDFGNGLNGILYMELKAREENGRA